MKKYDVVLLLAKLHQMFSLMKLLCTAITYIRKWYKTGDEYNVI